MKKQWRWQSILVPLGLGSVLLISGSVSPALAHPSLRPAAQASGGSITVRDLGAPSCLDPIRALDADEYTTNAVFQTLVSLDTIGQPTPDLALRWVSSRGGKRFTLFLRHGVRFSDGNPLNASAVRFNLLRDAGPVGQKAGESQFLGPLKSVLVVNPYEVTMVFSTPFRPITTYLGNDALGIIDPAILKKEGSSKFCQYPVGSGPFEIKSYGPGGDPVKLVRNPYYHAGPGTATNKGAAHLSAVTVTPIVSDATAVSELLSGELDLASIPGSQLSRVRHSSSVSLSQSLQHQLYQLSFNTAHAPFNNVQVRKAIAEAVDRNALIKVALDGLGVAAFSPVPQNNPFYDSNSQKYAPHYDPADARKILSAHHISGTYTLMTFNSPVDTAAGEIIQAQLAQVGLNVKIVSKAIPDFVSLAAKGDYDLSLNWFYSLDPDIMYLTLHSSAHGGGGANWSFYKNAKLDSLIDQGRVTINKAKDARIYAQVQRIVDTNVVMDPLWLSVGVFASRKNLKGFHTDVSGLYPVYEDLYLQK